MKKEYWWLLGGLVAGVVLAPTIRRTIPGANKLPSGL